MAQCISPLSLNRGAQVVPCGKCNFCLSNNRQDWSFRLEQELKVAQSAKFLTLTYEAEHLPIEKDTNTGEPYFALSKQHLGRFHMSLKQYQNRWITKECKRQKLNKEDKTKLKKKWRIRYFSVGEYGSNNFRPHYHLILFNIHPTVSEAIANGQIWSKGFVKFGEVNSKTINYTCKYVIDKEPEKIEGKIKPFKFMSKNPGLGHNYLEHNTTWHKSRGTARFYKLNADGSKGRLPRYYKERIFSKVERQVYSIEAQFQSDALYESQIEALENMHYANPYQELEFRRQYAHAKIRIKSQQLNTF